MAQIQRFPVVSETVPQLNYLRRIALAAFAAVLALAIFASPTITAGVGLVLLFSGLGLAAALYLLARPQSLSWDLAALATFLGFAAILISDATVPAL